MLATCFRRSSGARAYSVGNSSGSPIGASSGAVNLFHEPHYVLPPLTPCRSVMTIHDCIHLSFPQSFSNRVGYAYARASAVGGDAQGRRIMTCRRPRSATSSLFHVPEEKIDVIHNAIDERFNEPPAPGTSSA